MRLDLLSLAVLIVGCLLVGQAAEEVEVADSASPIVQAFQVTPLSAQP